MRNILYSKETRTRWKKWFHHYYEKDSVSLKEKLYTIWFRDAQKGQNTLGELAFEKRIKDMAWATYRDLREEFKKDYTEFALNPKEELQKIEKIPFSKDKYHNFLVQVDCEFQFNKVKEYLEKLYPECSFGNHWKYSYENRYVIGFNDKPTYDFLIAHTEEHILTFREFLNETN